MDNNENIFAAVVDLETTGLDAIKNIPLELGIKLIDKEGFIFAEDKWLIAESHLEWKIEMGMGAAHEFVGPMHEKSGLWDDLIASRELDAEYASYTRAGVDEMLCQFLSDNGAAYGKVPMMGNSIGSLDRPFVIQHFPDFNKHLSYRNIDVSTIKEICKAVNPTLFENLLPIIGDKSMADHRVMSDIDACITEYRAYLDNFFFTEE